MGLGNTGLGSGGGVGGIDFTTSEQDTGLKWLDEKTVFQKTISLGTMPNATMKSVAHNITDVDADTIKLVANGTSINNGAGSDTFPLPAVYDSAIGNQIRLDFDATNINVTTGINYSAYTGVVTIQYNKT